MFAHCSVGPDLFPSLCHVIHFGTLHLIFCVSLLEIVFLCYSGAYLNILELYQFIFS